MMMQYPALAAVAVAVVAACGLAAWMRFRGSPAERAERQWLSGLGRPTVGPGALFTLCIATVLLPFTLTVLVDRVTGDHLTRTNSGLLSGEFPLSRTMAVVIFLPFVEELAFRGLLLRSLSRRIGTVAALIGSAVAFALAHDIGKRSPYFLMLGIIFGCVAMRADSVWPSYAMHVVFNATVAVMNRLFRNGDDLNRWVDGIGGTPMAIAVLLAAFGIIIWQLRRRPIDSAERDSIVPEAVS